MPSEISCLSLLMSRIMTSTSSPMLTTSLGWLIRRVHVISLMCIESAALHDGVHAGLVDLDDLAEEVLVDVLGDVADAPNRDLRRGEEDRHADVDEQPALDLPRDPPGDRVAALVGRDHLLPA